MSQDTDVSAETDIISRLSAFQAAEDKPNEPVEAVPVAEVATTEAVSTGTEEVPEQPEETVEADTLVDIEFDGKILKGSPEIREAVMRHADYTRKTMELAEHRALFQRNQEIAEHNAAFNQSIETENTELAQLDAQLAQFKALPWDEFDMQQHVKAKHAQDLLKERRAELQQAVEAKRNEFAQQTHRSKQELVQTGIKYLNKVIPGWGKEAFEGMTRAAKAVGFADHEIGNMVDPRAIHALWKADQWDKLQAAKPNVQKKVAEAPPVVKPGSQATTESRASTQYKDQRKKLRESGSVDDAARLFMMVK